MNLHRVRPFAMIVLFALVASAPAYATAPPGRYMLTEKTAYDTKTKLTWQRADAPGTYTWAGAKSYCASVGASLDGQTWRLPTVKELQTIVDHMNAYPAVDATVFSFSNFYAHWTLSRAIGKVGSSIVSAWYVDFGWGESTWINVDEAVVPDISVRCVR